MKQMPFILLKLLGLLVPVALIVVLDQYTKGLVRASVPLGHAAPALLPGLAPWFTIIHTANTGVAFGSLTGMNTFFMILVTAVGLFIIYYYLRMPRASWLIHLGLILLLGGNIGNLIDRANQGYVTDFLAIRWFAVINLADACITTGVALAALGYWLGETEQKTESLRSR